MRDLLNAAMVRRPLFIFALCFIAGLLIETFSPGPLAVLVPLLAAIIFTALILRGKTIIFLTIFLCGGMLRLAVMRTPAPNDIRFGEFDPDSSYSFRGKVRSVGESASGKQRLVMDIFSLCDSLNVTGSVWSYLRDPVPVTFNDTITGNGFFRPPAPRANPMDFDFGAYLAKNQVYWLLYPDPKNSWVVRPDSTFTMTQKMGDFRDRIAAFIHRSVPDQPGYLLSALLLGLRSDVDDEIIQWFSETGVIHVLAVSGLHVGYVTLILMVIMSFLRLPYRWQVWGTVVGLMGYSLLTGAAPSVLRASTMAALYLWGTTLERRVDLYNLLGAAALGMLVMSPEQLWRVGFQLSFAAVFSIAYFFPRLKKLIPENVIDLFQRKKWLGYSADLLLVSFAAQIGTLPFTIAYFHKIPIIGLFANLVVIPLIGLIVALGFALLLLGSWIPIIGGYWGALLTLMLELLVKFVELMHRAPLAYISVPPIHPVWLILMIFTFLLLFSTIKRKGYVILVEGFLVANYLIWDSIWITPGKLTVAVLDVGQGDAIVVQTPMEKTIVIDCGSRFGGDDMGADVVGPYLNYIAEDTIDLLILTHPHNDHIGGAPWLLRHFPVKRLWQPQLDYDSYTYREIQFLIDSLAIRSKTPFAGEVDSSFAPLFLRVMAPDSSVLANPPSTTNDYSIVIQAIYGNARSIFSGDAEAGSEMHQVQYGSLLASDLIKVPHHGNLTSSTFGLLNEVSPKWAVISVGRRNKFRHPARSTVARYLENGAQVKRTDQDQAIIFESNGDSLALKSWQND